MTQQAIRVLSPSPEVKRQALQQDLWNFSIFHYSGTNIKLDSLFCGEGICCCIRTILHLQGFPGKVIFPKPNEGNMCDRASMRVILGPFNNAILEGNGASANTSWK